MARRGAPLSDPRRAKYARAALDRRDRAHERERLAALADDPKRQARAVSHVRECLALLDDAETAHG